MIQYIVELDHVDIDGNNVTDTITFQDKFYDLNPLDERQLQIAVAGRISELVEDHIWKPGAFSGRIYLCHQVAGSKDIWIRQNKNPEPIEVHIDKKK